MNLEKKYWSYVRFVKFILSMTGMWPAGGSNGSEIVHQKLAVFSCILSTGMGFAVSYFCWFHSGNLEVLMKGVGFLGTVILMLVKIVAFIRDRELLSGLMDTLGLLSSAEFDDPELRPLLLGLLPILRRYSYVQSISVGYATLSYNLIPLIVIVHQKLSGILPVSYLYPFPCKFPWDQDEVGGTLYVVHYLFNVAIGWVCFSSIVGPDALFCLFVVQLCGRLRILAHNFRNLTTGYDYENKFRDCVRRHCLLARCRDDLQRVYGGAILFQFTSNALVMCASVFQITQMKTVSAGKALTFVFYFTAKLVQAFIYSWCGTMLTTESEAVSNAAYSSDWEKLSDPKVMRNVLMVISQRPLILTACRFSVVSLRMFTAVLNTTVSYFFLLKTVEEK